MVTSNIATINVHEQPALEIGNWNYADTNEDLTRKDARLTWDVVLGITPKRPGTTVIMQKFETSSSFLLLGNLDWIKSRFDLATQYKDRNNYGIWLFHEEIWHPSLMAKFRGSLKLNTWQIDGKAILGRVELKMIKTWIIEDKKQSWDQTWWNNCVINNSYSDPLVWEWSTTYGLKLYQAWHQHMQDLGKKSSMVGIGSLCGGTLNCFDSDWKKFYTPEMWNYIISNYDSLVIYQYPRNMSEITNSIDMAKKIREKYYYNGKLLWILTGSFKASWLWNWTKEIAWEEFKVVAPYVNVIITYQYAQDSWDWNDKQFYAATLIQFYEDYNNL